ncbi:MFS transporter [Plantibacter sp. H53]|uniref:MFS transporter n=1 Tax=Plantibacter sp. H53 TaxID=1827323 RepID=UPI000A742EFD|nr:MFS transporter [Plantibacter sp. H53]
MSSPSAIPSSQPSAWAPIAITAFRVLWFAQLGSNIGTAFGAPVVFGVNALSFVVAVIALVW